MSIVDDPGAQGTGTARPGTEQDGTEQDGSGRRPWLRRHGFLVAFGLVALVIAGVLSYAASSSPDGLDSATQRGCQTVMVNGAEQLHGNCIAQHATDHAMSSSPLADYSVSGLGNSGGIAGVLGVVVTVLVAGGLFWLLARGRRAAVKR